MLPGIIPDAVVKTNPGHSLGSRSGQAASNRHLLLDIIYFALIFLLVVLLIFALTLAHYLRRKEAKYSQRMADELKQLEALPGGDSGDFNNQLEFIQTIPHITTTAAPPTTTTLPDSTTNRQIYEPNEQENIASLPARATVCSPSGRKLSPASLDCTCTIDELIQQQQQQQQPMGSNQNCCLSRRTTTTPIIDQNNQHQHNQQQQQHQPRQRHDLANNNNNNNNKLAPCKRQEHQTTWPSNQFNHMNFTHQHLSNNNNNVEPTSNLNHVSDGGGGNDEDDDNDDDDDGGDGQNDANMAQLEQTENDLYGKEYTNDASSFRSNNNFSCCSKQHKEDKQATQLDDHYDNLQVLTSRGIYTRGGTMSDEFSHQRSKSLPRKTRQTMHSLLALPGHHREDNFNRHLSSNMSLSRGDSHNQLNYHSAGVQLNDNPNFNRRHQHHLYGHRNNPRNTCVHDFRHHHHHHQHPIWATRYDTLNKPLLCQCPLFVETSSLLHVTMSDQNNNMNRIRDNQTFGE